ncbi:MAG: hypothetical protein AAF236_17890, partial [Verrucomicrobiota bacterium]
FISGTSPIDIKMSAEFPFRAGTRILAGFFGKFGVISGGHQEAPNRTSTSGDIRGILPSFTQE